MSYKNIIFCMACIVSCCFISVAYSYWSENLCIIPVPPKVEEKLVIISAEAIEQTIDQAIDGEVIQDNPIARGSVPGNGGVDSVEKKDSIPETRDSDSTEKKDSIPETKDSDSAEKKGDIPKTEASDSTEKKDIIPKTEASDSTEKKDGTGAKESEKANQESNQDEGANTSPDDSKL